MNFILFLYKNSVYFLIMKLNSPETVVDEEAVVVLSSFFDEDDDDANFPGTQLLVVFLDFQSFIILSTDTLANGDFFQ